MASLHVQRIVRRPDDSDTVESEDDDEQKVKVYGLKIDEYFGLDAVLTTMDYAMKIPLAEKSSRPFATRRL